MSLLNRILRRDPQPEDDDFWADLGYGPDSPCPYPICHHNQPDPGGLPAGLIAAREGRAQ